MIDFGRIENEVLRRMLVKSMGPDITQEFLRRVELVYRGDSGKIRWEEILDLRPEDSLELTDLPLSPNPQALMQQLAVVKLNGGLGTSMGLTSAKSVLPVRDGKNFLGIIREQIDLLRSRTGVPVPLIFMNSFNTVEDFRKESSMQNLNPDGTPSEFLQNMVPRIYEQTLLPIGDGSSEDHWCPPGHGDVYIALKTSGILTKLLDSGRRVAFISNGDNLGATVDERIVQYFLDTKLEFAMEITPKSPADLKGGVLFRRRGFRNISLLETAQVEDEHIKDFEDTSRFPYFSINNLYVHLETLRDRLATGLSLSLIVNPKKWEGKDVLQLEAAMGSACENFANMKVIRVARDRFAPVKNCSDLLVRRSDACVLRDTDKALTLHPDRRHVEPVVRLDDNYKKLGDFEKLCPVIPSLIAADLLTVSGPVLFDVPLRIEGKVKIENKSGSPVSVSKIGRGTLANEDVVL
jgi:UTP--glucose-1-phosphate uridylyltransferase